MQNTDILLNIVTFLISLLNIIPIYAKVVGLFFCGLSLYKVLKVDSSSFGGVAQSELTTKRHVIWMFLGGIMLLNLELVTIVEGSTFLDATQVKKGEMAYVNTQSRKTPGDIAKIIFVAFTSLLGRIMLIRGIMEWITIGGNFQQPKAFSRGVTLQGFGIILANMRLFISTTLNTF